MPFTEHAEGDVLAILTGFRAAMVRTPVTEADKEMMDTVMRDLIAEILSDPARGRDLVGMLCVFALEFILNVVDADGLSDEDSWPDAIAYARAYVGDIQALGSW